VYKLISSAVVLILIGACDDPLSPADSLRHQFETAIPGTTITVPAGIIEFKRSLILNVDGVTVRGAGMDKSILTFKNQIAGAEGMLVNASDFTIEDLAIEDSKGDALKINEGKNIIVRRVRTEWTNGPDVSNGSYGIYPVQTENTLIEHSVAIAASDAGIYVGQSKNVVVRYSRAEYNVAGIEIENTIDADVYENIAINNTGGILVFNMPDLPQEGHSTRVYNNQITNNNTENFAPAGTAVSYVPAGSGVVINSNDKVEIFDNKIANNKTANVLITSNFASGYSADIESHAAFDPYPETIYIYNNQFAKGGNAPDIAELEQLRVTMFGENGNLPDVLWDGFINPEKLTDGVIQSQSAICIPDEEVTLLDLDMDGEFANPSIDMSSHRCQHTNLDPVKLAPPLA